MLCLVMLQDGSRHLESAAGSSYAQMSKIEV